jgi:integrase
MYNAEVKERFLSEYTGNGAKSIKGRFELIEESERLLGKDIAEMSKSEAILSINKLDFIEMGSAESILSAIKCYVRWCIDNRIFDNAGEGFLQVLLSDIDPSASMARMFFRDEYDFLYSMRKIREFDELQNDVIALIFAWLGLSIEEALDLRDEDIDFEARKIYNRNGTAIVSGISDEFAEILHQYQRAKSAVRQNGTTTYEVIKDLSHDGFIKRVCSTNSDKLGTKIPPRQLVSAINKLNQKYAELGFNPRFSVQNANRCGGLYRLWTLEQSGFVIEDKKNSHIVEEVYGSKQYRKILWQYKYYKKAFNL